MYFFKFHYNGIDGFPSRRLGEKVQEEIGDQSDSGNQEEKTKDRKRTSMAVSNHQYVL